MTVTVERVVPVAGETFGRAHGSVAVVVTGAS